MLNFIALHRNETAQLCTELPSNVTLRLSAPNEQLFIHVHYIEQQKWIFVHTDYSTLTDSLGPLNGLSESLTCNITKYIIYNLVYYFVMAESAYFFLPF